MEYAIKSALIKRTNSGDNVRNGKLDILLLGVGGQGILTSAAILGRAAVNADVNVLGAETHGMAQRGGSVEVHIRLGDVYSPLIPVGGADAVVSLEPVEALRYSKYYNEDTKIILNSRKIVPLSVSTGGFEYPSIEKIKSVLDEIVSEIYSFDATAIAETVANQKATNVVMIGALSKLVELPFTVKELEDAVKQVLPEKLHKMNLRALRAGYDFF